MALCFLLRSLFWTEWSRSIARIQKGSMDGNGVATLFQINLQRPYAVSVDFADQILYWADAGLDRIESANVDGSNRRVVISSGLNEPFDLTILGDVIYISDTNLGILAANKSGHQPVEVIYDRFCEHVGPVGIQAVAQERQLLGECMLLLLATSISLIINHTRGYFQLQIHVKIIMEAVVICAF